MALTITEHSSATTYSAVAALDDEWALVPNRGYAVTPGTTSASIQFKGAYTGSPAAVHYRIIRSFDSAVIKDWTAFASPTIGGGNWLGTAVVPQGNSSAAYALVGNTKGSAYKLQVSEDGGSSVAAESVCEFRVGLAIADLMDQSNTILPDASGDAGTNGEAYAADCWHFGNEAGSAWGQLLITNQSAGSLLNYVNTRANCPVFYTAYRVNGANQVGIYRSYWASTIQPRLKAFGRKLNFITSGHGVSDATTYWMMDSEQWGETTPPGLNNLPYEDMVAQWHDLIVNDCGQTTAQVPWVHLTIGSENQDNGTYSPGVYYEPQGPNYDYHFGYLNARILRFNEKYPNMYCVGTAMDTSLVDYVHYNGAGHVRHAKRLAHGITTLLGFTTGFAPELVSAEAVDATTTDVTLEHGAGTDIISKSGGTSFTGFEVRTGGGQSGWEGATAVRTSPTTIRLTHPAAALTNGRRARYSATTGGPGPDAVRDNGIHALQPTSPVGLVASGTHLVAGANFMGARGSLHWENWRWTGSETPPNPIVLTPHELGPAQAGDKFVVLLHNHGWAASVITSLTLTPDVGSPVVATKYAAGARTTVFTAVLPGGATSVTASLLQTAAPAGYLLHSFSLQGWWMDDALVANRVPDIYYSGVGTAPSVSVTPTVPEHAAVLGCVHGAQWWDSTWNESQAQTDISAGYEMQAVGQTRAFSRIDATAGTPTITYANTGTDGLSANLSDGAMTVVVIASLYAPADLAPSAGFTGTPTSGAAPLAVTFTDTSTNTPTSWLWERNDGSGWSTFSTSQNPTQSFDAGTWSVRLTATNTSGSDTYTRTDYIVASAPGAVTYLGVGGVALGIAGQRLGNA